MQREVLDVFHFLRKAGNTATHDYTGTHSEALTALKLARQLGIWFYKTVSRNLNFNAGPFQPPPDPADATKALHAELQVLREERDKALTRAQLAEAAREAETRTRESAEHRAARDADERAIWEKLALEADNSAAAVKAELASVQAKAVASPPDEIAELIDQSQKAARAISLDEADTRRLVDAQLRARGWEVDTERLTHASGARPAKGRNMAIAEWPTVTGPADYALFVGTTLLAVVEAKRQRKNVSAALGQAERYSKGFKAAEGVAMAGGPWDEFKVPFLFATNGRPYLKQIETESGIWFRDSRKPTNIGRALPDWYTPQGLKAEFDVDREAADERLKAEPFNFGFPLRPYQQKAIEALEKGMAEGRRQLLTAMATGTGKTKLAIALLYRLLAAKRFRRICFVVDRSALGNQTEAEFTTTKVVSGKAFAAIYGLKGLEDVLPDAETQVHICTIQGLVKRVLYASDPKDVPSIDQYDLMLVDECHRGYTLDRELSEPELEFRNEDDYISKYRRVLEHFDAVRIGLTATPALHTSQIFGDPVFTYSYREAVIDGYLVDHEPPYQIKTKLSDKGIVFNAGDQVELFNTATGEIDLARAPDELKFDVEQFNKQVITQAFNQVVCEELVKHIDPSFPGKTLIFAATDGHADIVVAEMKKAYAKAGIPISDSAVRKITGSVDRVQDLIRNYRNDTNPRIAVTVDLLTTGIDVPSITDLVFLRRVNSRILYEQMLGRATRLCADLYGPGRSKEVFRIFDAVDLYKNLEQVTSMKPVVVNPKITFAQLFEELVKAGKAEHQDTICKQLAVKLRRRLGRLSDESRQKYEAEAGETPENTLKRLLAGQPSELAGWVKGKLHLGKILDWNPESGGTFLPISKHDDEITEVTRGYGAGQSRPEDYLGSFEAFVRENLNKIVALNVVVTRPRELTRQQLKELQLELAKNNFNDTKLRQAWRQARNEDIAASIIGFVRQAALKEPLLPYDERVKRALATILKSKPWTDPQRQWLQRIGEQMQKEIVVDRQALDADPFAQHGGFNRLNKQFGGELAGILSQINDELWKQAS
ncbi:type I restriction-modification system endonuclease [Hyphomicrobium sp.]|uniref:type I restriction-modification system endonuclease n=1 Tax=Hyphomicrobium sp. TaxID=82 RepID=UPI0025C7280A|nr:type I restriction-modification system endonuclease [Hyphomicrobium sp.]